MRKVKAIYIEPHGPLTEWGQAVADIVGPRHNLSMYDHGKPMAPQFADIEVAIDLGGENMKRPMFEASKNLKFWQMLTVGYDFGRDLRYAEEKELATSHCPGWTSAPGLAEAALMFMLMLNKNYKESQDTIRCGELHSPSVGDLEGQVLGIIGFGASGKALAHRAQAFGMLIMIIEPLPIEQELLDAIQPVFRGKPDAIDHVMSEADFISLHVPVTTETEGMIDSRRISLMKPTACLINVARGNLVDEAALHAALLQDKIGGIGTDVFFNYDVKPSQTLLDHPRFVALPHVSGSSPHSMASRAKVALENLDRIAEGLDPKYRVV